MDRLTDSERGLLLAAVLAGGAGDARVGRVLSCLDPKLSRRCADALAQLAAMPREARHLQVRRLTGRVLSPLTATRLLRRAMVSGDVARAKEGR